MSESVEITPEQVQKSGFKTTPCFADDIELDSDDIAEVLNLGIKYGLVSPPVYVIRDTDNDRLLHEIVSGEVFMTANLEKVQIDGAVFEHWKGQME